MFSNTKVVHSKEHLFYSCILKYLTFTLNLNLTYITIPCKYLYCIIVFNQWHIKTAVHHASVACTYFCCGFSSSDEKNTLPLHNTMATRTSLQPYITQRPIHNPSVWRKRTIYHGLIPALLKLSCCVLNVLSKVCPLQHCQAGRLTSTSIWQSMLKR